MKRSHTCISAFLIALACCSHAIASPGNGGNVDLPAASIPPLATLTSLKYETNREYTRVTLAFSSAATWEAHELGLNCAGTGRIYVDMKRARVGKGVGNITIGDGRLKGVRIGQYRPETVRVVFDVTDLKDYKVNRLPVTLKIVMDIRGKNDTGNEKGPAGANPPGLDV